MLLYFVLTMNTGRGASLMTKQKKKIYMKDQTYLIHEDFYILFLNSFKRQ